MFLKFLQKSQGNTCAKVIKKETFKKTFFYSTHLVVATSVSSYIEKFIEFHGVVLGIIFKGAPSNEF